MISNLDPRGLDLPSGSSIIDFLKLFDQNQGQCYWQNQELLPPVPLPELDGWSDSWNSDLEVMGGGRRVEPDKNKITLTSYASFVSRRADRAGAALCAAATRQLRVARWEALPSPTSGPRTQRHMTWCRPGAPA